MCSTVVFYVPVFLPGTFPLQQESVRIGSTLTPCYPFLYHIVMAKVKNPLFSLDAHGRIGDFSYLHRRHAAIVEKTPRLPYFLTLPVQYQRWLYQDYCYLWHSQSEATRSAYAAGGSRVHLTAFQYWLKYNLSNLPDIDLWWKLDFITGTSVYDSSSHGHTGTVIGATIVPGVIDNALTFNGLSDRVTTPITPPLAFTGDMTLMCSWKPLSFDRWHRIVSCDTPVNPRYLSYQHADNTFQAFIHDGVSGANPVSPLAYTTSVSHHLTLRVSSTGNVDLFVDGDIVATVPVLISPFTPLNIFQLGAYGAPPGNWANGIIDNVIKFNRSLDDASISRWSLRTWPVK